MKWFYVMVTAYSRVEGCLHIQRLYELPRVAWGADSHSSISYKRLLRLTSREILPLNHCSFMLCCPICLAYTHVLISNVGIQTILTFSGSFSILRLSDSDKLRHPI